MSNSRKRQRPTVQPARAAPSAPSFHSSAPLLEAPPTDGPRFADLQSKNVLHPLLLKTVTDDLKFDAMMPVQSATFDDLLVHRNDCLAQARTGTGKTLAFLLPAIQQALQNGQVGGGRISALVISPTRELSIQIATEAKALLQRFPGYTVKLAIGGTNKSAMADVARGCTILVATPGRLLDHLGDEDFQYKLGALQTLVLDEADRMLDMGFLPSIRQIIAKLPNKDKVPRQSMLFSATLGDNIDKVAHLILKTGYKFISTIPKGEAQTHDRVPQFFIRVPTLSDLAPTLLSAIRAEMASAKEFKAIVFASSARVSDYYGHILSTVNGLPPTSVLHSRLSQPRRTKITSDFRTSQNAICVATDVIARGMDFPGVTHVFQVGLPMDRESYIHRLGRTARAGEDGRGILILAEPETYFLRLLKGIDLQQYPQINPAEADVQAAVTSLENKGGVYQALLGYYKTFCKQLGWTPRQLVEEANIFAHQALGCPEVPGLQKSTIGKMGLKGVPGLVVLPNESRTNNTRNSDRGPRDGAGSRRGQRG